MRPLGVNLYETTLNESHLNHFIKLTDIILTDKKDYYGDNLSGQLKDEWEMTNWTVKCGSILKSHLKKYIKENYSNIKNPAVAISRMWVNEMTKYEYNPVHYHPFCDISAVLFLKVPKLEYSCIAKKGKKDGQLEFISNSFGFLENGLYTVEPEAGKLILFPSKLLHTVYPFNCDGVRRTISFNATWKGEEDAETYDEATWL